MRPLWLMTQSMFLIGLVLRQSTTCLWLCESRWLAYLAHILCPRNSSSELPQFLLWEWQLAQMPRHPFPSVQLCPTNHNTGFAAWRLYARNPTVSLCHCALRKEFSPTSACQTPSSNTGNFLHCFQIYGTVESVAFLVISLADFSTLRMPVYILPSNLDENIQISICHAEIFDSTQILRQTKSIVFQPLLTVSGS